MADFKKTLMLCSLFVFVTNCELTEEDKNLSDHVIRAEVQVINTKQQYIFDIAHFYYSHIKRFKSIAIHICE